MGRRLAAVGAVLALVAVTLGAAEPAHAGAVGPTPDALVWVRSTSTSAVIYRNGLTGGVTLTPGAVAFTGQFDGNAGGDLFVYNPGSGADQILHLTQAMTGWTTSVRSVSVNGTFKPFVGDFDGNGVQDIYWYAPGTANDYIWFFASDGSHSSIDANVNGTYRPLVLDADSDGRDDVLWYAPGTAPDTLWLFDGIKEGPTLHIQNVPQTINGTYQTVVDEFGVRAEGEARKSIIFYNPSGPDSMWVFSGDVPYPEHTSYPLPNRDGDYRLLPGTFRDGDHGGVFLYAPGLPLERLWAFGSGPGADVTDVAMPQVKGTYSTLSADLDSSGLTDIAWRTGDTVRIWHFTPSGRTEEVLDTVPPDGLLRKLEMSDDV